MWGVPATLTLFAIKLKKCYSVLEYKNKCKIVPMQRTVTEISYSSVKNIILLMYEKIAFFSWNKKIVMLLYISNILLRVELLWKKLKR